MKIYPILLVLLLAAFIHVDAQNGQTANDIVPAYEGHFRPGSNFGYFPPWKDTDLADIAAGNPALGIDGVGVRSIRPSLTEDFLETWGYDSRVDNYQYYFNLDLKDLTNIVGFPAPWHQDPTYHCSEYQSEMFANLYTDIWDDGENGTPVNDDNYLALYLYKVVTLYKDYVRFWEIWNEPGFDFTGARGWLPPGAPGNWWENNPDPCDYKLRAPIYHYVRTLRISYEVIKTLDPDAFVTVAGTGFPSFLDAILRNTDNPIDGSVSEEYPLGGGAYFDVMGYHSYPHLDGSLREWSNEIFDFIYYRHSDAAAEGILRRQANFQAVLNNYGYDGVTYPKKHWIITEANLPRATFSPQFEGAGGEEIQRNFLIKAVVQCIKNDIYQYHIFSIAESESFNDANHEFDLMGMYKKIGGTTPYNQVINHEGVAYKTASDMLYKSTFDEGKTNDLNLPEGVGGGAFVQENGQFVYVIWAETSIDGSEEASAVYSFPQAFNINVLERLNWDYAQTGQISTIPSQNISLTATPIFFREINNNPISPPAPSFTAEVTNGCAPITVQFTDQSSENTTAWHWSFPGGSPAISFVQNPLITYTEGGVYDVTLEVSNSAGENEITQSNFIVINDTPDTDFDFSVSDLDAFFFNTSSNANTYLWNFGDGGTSTEENPNHSYSSDGVYTVSLTASNDCGTFEFTDEVTISAGIITPPTAGFTASQVQGCSDLAITFTNQSSGNATNWSWSFPGATPDASTEQHPTVSYNAPGVYSVILVASNTAGTNTFIETDYIVIEGNPMADFEPIVSSSLVSLDNQSTGADTYSWTFGDGTSSTEINPSHTYSNDGTYTISLTVSNECGSSSTSQTVSILTAPTAGFEVNMSNGCAPFTVDFSNQASINTTNWAWSFPGGTPSASTQQNPSVTYETAGTYSVILVVSNDAGTNTLIESDWIVVNDVPEVNFSSSIMDNNVDFSNLSTNATAYSWDFGDGTNSTEASPSHPYSEQGSYEVVLLASNECGEVSTSQLVNITAEPVAGFTADVLSGCTPLTVQFNNQSSQNTASLSWSFPGGNPSTSNASNPVVVYETSGAYSVVLMASNASGTNTMIENNYITIQDEPTAEFNFSINGATVNFSNSSENVINYNWDFGDNNFSTTENPAHTYTEDGTYTVTLHTTNTCGMQTQSASVTILTPPTAGFTTDVTSGCAPLNVQFSDASSNNTTTWNWLFDGGNPSLSAEQNPSVLYPTPGTYNVSLEALNDAGASTFEEMAYVTVLGAPTAAFTFSVNGTAVSFNNTSTDADEFTWNFGDGTSNQAFNPTHSYSDEGIYTVTLTVSNDCGSTTWQENITIALAPSAAFSADILSGCAPMTVAYNDASSANANSWNWTFPGGNPANSTEQNPVVVYEQAGNYAATLEVSNSIGSDIISQADYIEVQAEPQANFFYSIDATTVNFFNNSTATSNVEWQFGDDNSSNVISPSHTYANTGTFEVLLIVSNECGIDTSSQLVNIVSVSTQELSFIERLALFPNPNDGQFILSMQGEARGQIEISIMDILGQTVQRAVYPFPNGQLDENFDLKQVASGTYLMQLRSDAEVIYKKIVINR